LEKITGVIFSKQNVIFLMVNVTINNWYVK